MLISNLNTQKPTERQLLLSKPIYAICFFSILSEKTLILRADHSRPYSVKMTKIMKLRSLVQLPALPSPFLWSYFYRLQQRRHPGMEWQRSDAVACSSQPPVWSSLQKRVSSGRVILGHGLQTEIKKTKHNRAKTLKNFQQ